MLTYVISMLLVSALALWLRPMVGYDDETVRYRDPGLSEPLRFELSFFPKRFLYAYAWAFYIKFSRLAIYVQIKSQLTVLSIRQALATMWFGRGLLHS